MTGCFEGTHVWTVTIGQGYTIPDGTLCDCGAVRMRLTYTRCNGSGREPETVPSVVTTWGE
jgi:hypothetical protein